MSTLKQYTFTHYVTDADLLFQRNLVRNQEKNDESWTLALLQSPERIQLTLNSAGSNSCFNVKLSLFDEDHQAKLEFVKRGWKLVGSPEAFLVPLGLLQSLTDSNCHVATIQVAVIKISTPPVSDKMPTYFRSPSDFVIECGDGVELHCHKDVLAAASLVFAAMFQSGMKESVENRVVMGDFNSDVVAAMLRFIYAGDWGNLSGVVERLYMAADEYDLDQLKSICTAEIIVSLSADTIVSTIRAARSCGDQLLMAANVDYMGSHKGEMSLVEVVEEASKPLTLSERHMAKLLERS